MDGKWLFSALAAGLLATALIQTGVKHVRAENASKPTEECTLQFDNATLADVPQVTTTLQMERGLSGRKNVGNGMLFTWQDDSARVFWMRGTPTPLSVAFIDSKGVVLQIEDMKPESDFLHWSTLPAREGLEMKMGEFQKLGIVPGSRLISRECKPIS